MQLNRSPDFIGLLHFVLSQFQDVALSRRKGWNVAAGQRLRLGSEVEAAVIPEAASLVAASVLKSSARGAAIAKFTWFGTRRGRNAATSLISLAFLTLRQYCDGTRDPQRTIESQCRMILPMRPICSTWRRYLVTVPLGSSSEVCCCNPMASKFAFWSSLKLI
jgi:hypothetical protein